MILYLDLETFCEVPINHGTHAYAEAAEVMLTQYAIDNGEPVVKEGLAEELPMLIDMADIVVTHTKDGFDRVVLHYQGIDIPLEKHHDTSIMALSHGLPGGLDKLCAIMGITGDMAKDKAGKQLIQLFCKPRPKTSKIRRATKETHPLEWGRFVSYAGQDIVAMRELYRKLPRVNYPSPREHALWCLDQRINDRGMRVDLALARGAISTVAAAKKIMDKRTKEITDDQLQSTTQRDKLLQLALADYGVALPDMQGATIERRLEDPDLPAGLRELLALRLQTATTSNAKYNRLLKAVSSDGRLRGALQFSGAARTKRWSGKVFQPQNLPRPDMEADEIALGIPAIIAGGAHLVWDEPIKLCSNAIRGCIVAEEGKKLVVSDLAQVEARVLPWLAGEQWKLEAFAEYDRGEAPDNYIMAYSRGFGVAPEEVDKYGRQIGKVSELSCGYGGAYAAWISMGALYGFDLPRHQVNEIVNAWRAAHPAICDWDTGLWKKLDDAARNAVQNPGKTFAAGEHIRFERWREWLRMELPSGGFLNYAAPAIMEDPRRPGQTCVSYMGVNNYTKKWERLTTYGGKLSADATQATAREIMAENLPEIEADGFDVILLVHDEVVTEVWDVDSGHTVERLNALLSRNPAWAEGLPLAAGGFEAYRYRKE
jgi:DNA polymerase